MLLSNIPELRNYPKVLDFVEKHLSMQFGDVRSMLRLPLPKSGIEYGCNFAATATLCNLISGISVTIFKPSKPTRTNHKSKRVWIARARLSNNYSKVATLGSRETTQQTEPKPCMTCSATLLPMRSEYTKSPLIKFKL